MNELSACVERLEQSVEKFEKINTLKKSLNRPMFEAGNMNSKSEFSKEIGNFIKYGEKALNSNDGRGNLILKKPKTREIISAINTPNKLREILGQTNINTDHFEMIAEQGSADAGWSQETEFGETTDLPDLKKINIPTHEMYARVQISQRLLDDSEVDLENWLTDSIENKFANLEEDSFINGDGENKPRGFLTYEHTEDDVHEWGKIKEFKTNKIGGIVDANVLIDIVSSFKTQLLEKAAWVMSRSAFAQIKLLKDAASGRYLWQPNLQDACKNTLLGFPVIISDAMPALIENKVSTPIAFGNFSKGYQIVDRKDMNVLRDPYSAKPFVEFFVTQRVGGDVINFDAIKVITAC